MAALLIRLYVISGPEGEKWAAEADTSSVRSIRTSAPRGEIYDRNGVLIAGNHPTYTVDFSRNQMSNEDANDSAKELRDILDKHGETIIDEFPIVDNADGSQSYSFDLEIAKWLEENDMPAGYSAAEAFDAIRESNNISASLSNADAQQQLADRGITPPISVSKGKFTQEIAKETFLQLHQVSDNPDAKGAYNAIRKLYEIDEQFPGLSEEEVRQLIVIRSALTSMGFNRWMPAKIASNLKVETVIELEEKKHDIEGMEIVTEYVRYYPENETASHVVGYLGHISQDKMSDYEKDGYHNSDIVGLSGIESAEENLLRGTDGIKRLQVDMSGAIVRELDEEIEAKRGKDIALTIDMRLQKIGEEALTKALKGIRAGGVFTSEFGNYAFEERSPNAEVAAVVAIDVKTGEPLAIANSQNFDPNLFAEGISTKDWNKLQGNNPRDPLAPRPLYNVAALTAVQPGSTFKPMTGIAAQAMGLDPYRELYDGHAIELGDHDYVCMGHHGYVNLFEALRVSCNYYFYDAATGRDWANGERDLGYAKKISVDTISGYAKKFGLGVKTGIEIGETVAPAPTADSKLEGTKAMLRQFLIGKSDTLFGEKAIKDYDKLMASIETIISWMEENPEIPEIRKRLIDLGVRQNQAQKLAEDCKYTYFNYAEWTTGDQFNIAIGQGENAFTPLQMARYLSTMGNGGNLESLSLIKAVEDKGEVERPKAEKTGVKKAMIKNVVTGMEEVVKSGTLSGAMGGIGVEVAGKTGTAQRAGYINPPDEVKYIREHLSGINPDLSWSEVNNELKRLMKEYPRMYSSKNLAVRKAVINLSGKNFNTDNLDAFKQEYADFAWVMAMAPADDPEIAVVGLVVQGGPSNNAAPIVREVLGQYFKLKKEDEKNKLNIDFSTFFTDDKTERLISGPAVTVTPNG
jgi:penicillin-binding protein 2